jgi:hypothetical protein
MMAALPPLKKILWPVAGFLAASTALMGFAHTKPGRPLLALLAGGQKPSAEQAKAGGGACPMGFSKQDASEKDATLKRQAEKLRGTQPSLSKPALGFTFDKTTKGDIEAWAKANNVTCKVPKVGADLDCSNVPADLVSRERVGPAVESLWFGFDSHERLVSLTAIRYDNDPKSASSLYTGTVDSLAKTAGPPTKSEGEAGAEYLAGGLWHRAKTYFAFNDYHAQASVVHLRQGQFMFVEEYRSLPN